MRLALQKHGCAPIDFEVIDVRWVNLHQGRCLCWQRPGQKFGIAFTEDFIRKRFSNIFFWGRHSHWQVV